MTCHHERSLLSSETVALPWANPPISLNDRGASRGAMYAKASSIADVRRTVGAVCRHVERPEGAGYLSVQLHYLPASSARRDTDNLAATTKPLFDALAAGTKKTPGLGLVDDDVPALMGKPEPIIWPRRKGDKARMWVVLEWWDTPPCPYHEGCLLVPATC